MMGIMAYLSGLPFITHAQLHLKERRVVELIPFLPPAWHRMLKSETVSSTTTLQLTEFH